MQNIGEKLEEARKRQGITIREAAEATKIRADFLIDFENNNFHQDLPDIYKRGFLKLYAKYLNLEADKLINDFNAGQLGVAAPKNKGNNFGTMDVGYTSHYTDGPDNEKSDKSNSIDKSLYIKIGAVLGIVVFVMVFIAIITSYVSSAKSSGNTQEPAANTSSTEKTETKEVAPTEAEVTLIAVGDCFITVQGSTDRNIFYAGSLSMGERIPVKVKGSVYIISDTMENIQVEKKGVTYSAPGNGMGKFLLE